MPQSDRVYRLLIVDDDETDRKLYAWLLARQAPDRFEIEHAVDGSAGLAALRERNFDCVLLDFSLPDVTGLEFLADTAIDGELPAAFVLITGHGNEAIAVDAMKLGVQDYLVKDHVNEGRLWRAIVRAVSQRELRLHLVDSKRALLDTQARLEQAIAARDTMAIELRAARKTAERAEKTRTGFVAAVARALRTPLESLLGHAEALRLEDRLGAHADAKVDGILRSARQLDALLEDMLELTADGTGTLPHRVAVSPREIAEECLAAVGPLADARGLSLHLVWSHDAPRQIVADPIRLRQALLNLLGNAVKFTVAGWVELRVRPGGTPGTVSFEVADTGPGIPDAARGRLIRPFDTLDVIAPDGSGLGLAIAARFVALLGGTIDCAPNPGGGSIVRVELPREQPTVAVRGRSPALPPASIVWPEQAAADDAPSPGAPWRDSGADGGHPNGAAASL